MIEYSFEYINNEHAVDWVPIRSEIKPHSLYLTNYVVRINGEIFSKRNEEFFKAFEKALFWDKLSNKDCS